MTNSLWKDGMVPQPRRWSLPHQGVSGSVIVALRPVTSPFTDVEEHRPGICEFGFCTHYSTGVRSRSILASSSITDLHERISYRYINILIDIEL